MHHRIADVRNCASPEARGGANVPVMDHALVLLGHADPDSFNARLARAYADAWRAAGGAASLVPLAELSFDPVLRRGYAAPQPLEPDLATLRAAFESAAHVVWVFPTYWASTPAIVRAVIDRLFVPGWAFRYPPGGTHGLPEGLLAGRSARVITTMDSPRWAYWLFYLLALHGAFVRGTLRFVGLGPIATTFVHGVRALGEAARDRWSMRVAAQARADLARLRRS